MNKELEKRLYAMLDHVKIVEELVIEHEKCDDRIDNLERKINSCKMQIILQIIIVIFATGILVNILSLLIGDLSGVFSFICIGGGVVAMLLIKEKYNKSKEKDKEVFQKMIENEKEQQEEIVQTLRCAFIGSDEVLLGLPEDYHNSIAINEMYKYVSQGRAQSIPEAINLFEEQLHRWKIEGQNDLILQSQQRQEQRLANIEFYSALSSSLEAASYIGRD